MAKEMKVLIVGPADSGKTTVQRIVTAALREHGITATLGVIAQHEERGTTTVESYKRVALDHVVRETSVLVDEVYLHPMYQGGIDELVRVRAPLIHPATREISDAEIKTIMLAHGYKEKDQGNGVMDLNPYVYEAARALMNYKPAPILPADTDAPKLFEIWTTGYRATGNDIKAEKLGEEYGATFAEACLLFFKKQGKSDHLEINGRGVPHIPGFCHLTDNETDARRFNG